jgi:hypothetical protein
MQHSRSQKAPLAKYLVHTNRTNILNPQDSYQEEYIEEIEQSLSHF